MCARIGGFCLCAGPRRSFFLVNVNDVDLTCRLPDLEKAMRDASASPRAPLHLPVELVHVPTAIHPITVVPCDSRIDACAVAKLALEAIPPHGQHKHFWGERNELSPEGLPALAATTVHGCEDPEDAWFHGKINSVFRTKQNCSCGLQVLLSHCTAGHRVEQCKPVFGLLEFGSQSNILHLSFFVCLSRRAIGRRGAAEEVENNWCVCTYLFWYLCYPIARVRVYI